MMISLRKPTHSQLKEFLWNHQDLPFTYEEVEETRGDAIPRSSPSGYSCGLKKVRLGEGRECYLEAKRALQDWKMFPADFVDIVWPAPLEAGRVVATLFHAPFVWTLNPCRIVYTVDETITDQQHRDIEQFGFAYGTVGRHFASGEERFLVEYHHHDQSVWYEIYCFSKVNHGLSIVAYPYLRLQQYRFREKSAAAMRNAVANTSKSILAACGS